MLKRIECNIAGSSFGANSLTWAKNLGLEFGLKGEVFAREDGSVSITAEGEEKNLVAFLKKVSKGPFLSRVENFYFNWQELRNEPRDINIVIK